MPTRPATEPDGFAPGPRQRVRGSYNAAAPAGRGHFGPREASSLAANTALQQPIAIAVAFKIEELATANTPGLPMGVAGISAWLLQTVIWILLKLIANWLRNSGGSYFRDFVAWVWATLIEEAWISFREAVRSALLAPFRALFSSRRRRVKPDGEEEGRDGGWWRRRERRRRRPVREGLAPSPRR